MVLINSRSASANNVAPYINICLPIDLRNIVFIDPTNLSYISPNHGESSGMALDLSLGTVYGKGCSNFFLKPYQQNETAARYRNDELRTTPSGYKSS